MRSLITRVSALFLCFFIIHNSSFVIASDWPQFQRDARRTARSPERIEPPYEVAWHHDFLVPERPEHVHPAAQPVIAGGKLFVGVKEGIFYAFDAKTGKILWQVPLDGAVMHSAAVENGRVFVATLSGSVYALSSDNGKEIWRFRGAPGARFSSAPLLYEGRVFLPSRNGVMHALEQADGNLAWTQDLQAPLMQAAAADNGRIFVGAEDMFVYALDSATGKHAWRSAKRAYGSSFRDYCPVIAKGRVIVRSMPAIVYPTKEDALLAPFQTRTGFEWPEQAGRREAWAQLFLKGEMPEELKNGQALLIEQLKAAPYLQTFYMFDENTGEEAGLAPITHCGVMSGPVPPPAVTADDNLVIPCEYLGHLAVLDPAACRITRVFHDHAHRSAETWNHSIAGDIVLRYHCRDGWGGNLAHDLSDNSVFKDQSGPMLPGGARPESRKGPWMHHCTQGGGGNAPAIADDFFYHIAMNRLTATRTQKEANQ